MTPRDSGPHDQTLERPQVSTRQAHLRILATTDIHMQLVGFNYVTDSATSNSGFAGITTLIQAARSQAEAEHRACILLDNGDLLQGNAMGDILARTPVTSAHPVAALLNHLRYDAVGLGNHDLDHGLPYLSTFAAQLAMPLVATNLTTTPIPNVHETALITSALPCSDGTTAQLKLGILSLLPAQTAIWNRFVLQDVATVTDPVDAAHQAIVTLRKQGAEVIIVLAHMGISAKAEDSALLLARIPGVDAIITGHTHRRFPGADHVQQRGVDIKTGLLANRPGVMPGHSASDLAVLDLDLTFGENDQWRVRAHQSELRRNTGDISPDPKSLAICAPAHHRARDHLARKLGKTETRLHNYFTLAEPTQTCALIARAKALAMRDAVAGTSAARLPILATAPAHTAGGRGGPGNFLDIAPGDVLRRHLAGLSPYANSIWGLKVSGRDLRAWLEHAALVFAPLRADLPDQLLNDQRIPIYNFDTIYGLSYAIDPTRPPGRRIRNLMHDGAPVAANKLFLLATNQFRAAGGGGYANLEARRVLLKRRISNEAALIDALRHPDDTLWHNSTPWHLSSADPLHAVIHTAPKALDHLSDIAHLNPKPLGSTPAGFARIRLNF